MGEIVNFIVESIGALGYWGIFLLMFLESSFFPFPSEVVMVPAGYLAFKGEMNIYIAILWGALGSLGGALFNYYLSMFLGRRAVLRFGKYFFMDEDKLSRVEAFFKEHGHISTFSGRLIPGVRQYISLPAGLARMNIFTFSIYTTLGAGIWVAILAYLGYFIGGNEELIKEYLRSIIIVILFLLLIGALIYMKKKRLWFFKPKYM
ncbi:MAG: DedA family protein [Campylobacterales bacterium]